MSVLTEVAAKLAALGCGTLGTTLFMAQMPETPDACCCVYEYGGSSPTMGFGTAGVSYESPSVQVVFRGAVGGYASARALAETAYRGLAAVEAATLSAGVGGTSAFYHWIHPNQSPFALGPDGSGRPRVAFNVLCEKELSS